MSISVLMALSTSRRDILRVQRGAWLIAACMQCSVTSGVGNCELAGAHAFFKDRPEQVVVVSPEFFDAGALRLRPFPEQHEQPDRRGMVTHDHGRLLGEQPPQPLPGRALQRVNRLFKVGDHVPAAGLDGGSDQLFLAREIVVEGTLGDVEPVRDVVEADGVVAALADFSRGQTRNLCFGLGPHYCIGAPWGS